jgi:hypothetical protein
MKGHEGHKSLSLRPTSDSKKSFLISAAIEISEETGVVPRGAGSGFVLLRELRGLPLSSSSFSSLSLHSLRLCDLTEF